MTATGASGGTVATDVAVVGAGGLVGRRIARELADAGLRVTLIGRRAEPLQGVVDDAPYRVADASVGASLATAIAGARLVLNAAGPLRDTASPVLEAALRVGASYVDVGGEQAVLRELVERHESAVRRAGLVAVPGAGFDGTLGDLAARVAATHMGVTSERPLDEVAISYVFDDLVLSAGSQRALFGAAFARPLVWRRDRWEPCRTGDVRRVDAGPGFGGAREAMAYAGGSAITLPRHLAARLVATFASTTRRASGLMRLVASALPLVPRAAGVLAAYAAPDADYTRTRFAVVAQVRRGFDAAQVVLRGQDLYATTAAITAGIAIHLLDRDASARVVGMRAAGELVDAGDALRALGERTGLSVETSFGAT